MPCAVFLRSPWRWQVEAPQHPQLALFVQCGQRQQAAAGKGGGDARRAQFGENLQRQLVVVGQCAGGQAKRERGRCGEAEQ